MGKCFSSSISEIVSISVYLVTLLVKHIKFTFNRIHIDMSHNNFIRMVFLDIE